MKSKLIAAGFLAVALAGTASAHCILVTVVCPTGQSAAGIKVCATPAFNCVDCSPICGHTDATGLVVDDATGAPGICLPADDNWKFCVDTSTLPAGTTVSDCQTVLTGFGVSLEFTLSGAICSTPVSGPCWETGGGTLDKVKGDNVWTFGGVIYPGCSPKAAGGGNLNIVNHVTGLHFKGENFVVDDCRGTSDKSPKVKVNIIDWHGTGEVTDASGKNILVNFVGTFRDSHDSGRGADGLYIKVTDETGALVFQIGGGPDNLDLLTTGNVQIHQSGCGKR